MQQGQGQGHGVQGSDRLLQGRQPVHPGFSQLLTSAAPVGRDEADLVYSMPLKAEFHREY